MSRLRRLFVIRTENSLPNIIQKTLTTAHRGDSSAHRENTLVAIQSAIDLGADLVEIDIRQSKDGQVIVLHDQSLERLWGYPFDSVELPLEDIAQIGFGECRIPTLAQTLDLFKNSKSTLMIDMDTELHALPSLQLVQASNLSADQVIWCGNLQAMKLIRSHSPEARIWMPWNDVKPIDRELISELAPEMVNSHYSFWNKENVSEIHELGLGASAWTIDDAPTMRWAKEIGIDSVTTNDLRLLQSVIDDVSPIDPLDLDRANELATSIGKWAILICQEMKPGVIRTKVNPADLVTEVDLFIEMHVREMIVANFPTHNIIGEEFGGDADALTPTWYVDPVDGTTNFANGTPWSSFSLALALGREPLVAVTIDPWRNSIFQAVKARGAFINGVKAIIPEFTHIENPLAGRVVFTELAGSKPWDGMPGFLDGLHDHFCTMRIMGAGTLSLTAVSANYGVGAVVHQFSPIDHLAAALIAKESGCIVLNSAGDEDLFPESGGMLIVQPAARNPLYRVWQSEKVGVL